MSGRTPATPERSGDPAGAASTREVLRRLELSITRKLDGLLQGDYRGLVPGHGSEPGEVREYSVGDDVRRIDWNVTARMRDPHVRMSIADRELETWVLVDLSPSLDFGTANFEKRDLSIAAVGAMGFLTAKVGNRFGAMITDGNTLRVVPAKAGRAHLMAILHTLHTFAPPRQGPPTVSLSDALRRLSAPGRRRGLAVVVSDLIDSSPWPDQLKRLSVVHDTVVAEIIDPRELALPDVGMLTVVDVESGAVRELNTRDRKLRERYAEAARDQRARHAAAVRDAGADHIVLRTDRDWLRDIVDFITLRRKRQEVTPRR